jgi:hypothetical protein
MPGLVPGIHAVARAELTFSEPCATALPRMRGLPPAQRAFGAQVVDGRDRPGHDGQGTPRRRPSPQSASCPGSARASTPSPGHGAAHLNRARRHCHGCAGSRPRSAPSARKSWMAGTSPAMTGRAMTGKGRRSAGGHWRGEQRTPVASCPGSARASRLRQCRACPFTLRQSSACAVAQRAWRTAPPIVLFRYFGEFPAASRSDDAPSH